MSNEEGGGRKIKKKQTTQRQKSTEFVYDNKQISLALIITSPSVTGRNVKYDILKQNKKTYNTFKGEHIDDFDGTFIEKRQTKASAFRNHMDRAANQIYNANRLKLISLTLKCVSQCNKTQAS